MPGSNEVHNNDTAYSRAGNAILPPGDILELERLKKEWYHYALVSIEKTSNEIENLRRIDLENLKKDLKERIDERIGKVDTRLDKVEDRSAECKREMCSVMSKSEYREECRFDSFKKDFFNPMETTVEALKTTVTTLVAKIGVWAVLCGIVGTGVFQLFFWMITELLKKNVP